MSNPDLELQKAMLNAIVAAVPMLGGRVFDTVPASALYPYVTIGEGQVLPDRADCIDGSEIFADVHVWSRKPGFVEAKQIAGAIRTALDDADLPLDGHALIQLLFRDERALRDPDGLTSHIAMTFHALTEAES